MARKSKKELLKEVALKELHGSKKKSVLEDYRDVIEELLEQGAKATHIKKGLEAVGVSVSVATVRNFIKRLRGEKGDK